MENFPKETFKAGCKPITEQVFPGAFKSEEFLSGMPEQLFDVYWEVTEPEKLSCWNAVLKS
jgi:hypothetical protein